MTSFLSSLTHHPNTALHCFPEASRVVSYKALSFIRALIILGIKVLMFNHRQATGHKLTAALRQQSARSTQGIPRRSRACIKLQDKQKKERERETTQGWVVFKYLSDYLDTHHQIVLNFKPTDMDIKWFATDWHWTWCPSAEHARRLSHSLECRAAESTDMLCSTLGCLAPINQNTPQYGTLPKGKTRGDIWKSYEDLHLRKCNM